MVELRPDGRQWTLVNRSIPDFKSVMPRDELVVAYSKSGRHALTPSSVREKTKPFSQQYGRRVYQLGIYRREEEFYAAYEGINFFDAPLV